MTIKIKLVLLGMTLALLGAGCSPCDIPGPDKEDPTACGLSCGGPDGNSCSREGDVCCVHGGFRQCLPAATCSAGGEQPTGPIACLDARSSR